MRTTRTYERAGIKGGYPGASAGSIARESEGLAGPREESNRDRDSAREKDRGGCAGEMRKDAFYVAEIPRRCRSLSEERSNNRKRHFEIVVSQL